MKKLIILLFICLAANLYSLTITIAPLDTFSSEGSFKNKDFPYEKKLMEILMNLYRWENLNFNLLNPDIPAPRSFLDALKISGKHKLDYILYGFIEEKELSLYGEIKLFDRARKEVVQLFFSGDDLQHPDRLVRDLAEKIGAYFSSIPGLGPEIREAQSTEGLLSLGFAAGYWPILSPQWYDSMFPLYRLDLKAVFTPYRPAPAKGISWPYFRSGLELSFFHSQNQPGQEGFNLLTLTIGIPLEIVIDLGHRHSVGIAVTPGFLLDYLILERLHDNTSRILSLGFAGAATLEYRYHLTNKLSLGFLNRVELHFFDPVRLSYNPALLVEYHFNPQTENKPQGDSYEQ